MAKNVDHIQHIKSNVVLETGKPKLPQPNILVEGELAINYAEGVETISIKNSSGDVVTFSSDNYYTEKKLGSGFTGENSAVTVTDTILWVSGTGVNSVVLKGSSGTASGDYSVAEGYYTKANGYGSHAEGGSTTANGNYSHAEGLGTLAQNQFEHASGQYNISKSASTTFGNSGNTLFSVGNGTADDARHNAFEIRQNGDIYITSGSSDIKLQDYIGKVETVIAITPSNSGSTDPIATKVVAENELTVSNALTDLDERKLDASAYTPVNESSGITAMTGYAMAASGTPISTSDTLNAAIGKLEKRISLLETSVADLNSQSETVAAALVELHSEIGDIETLLSQI